ncbi:MAG: hypothetical protein WEB58_03510 [Planctomycetaceae bacterium]
MAAAWGAFLIAWTARLTVFAYLFRIASERFPVRIGESARRWSWTFGGAMCVVHVACTFEFAHDWSHTAAWNHTDQRMRELLGWGWGGGVYVNYVFTLAWLADVAWWWADPTGHRVKLRPVRIALHALFFVVIVNATVVFGPPFWIGVAIAFALLMLLPRNAASS